MRAARGGRIRLTAERGRPSFEGEGWRNERSRGEGDPCRWVLLGDAGSDPKRPGVLATRVGYSGGDVENATYRNHGTHAEAIEITFDPEQTSYRELLEFFFQIHDPTTLNRQGNDVGMSYRSAIFYLDDEQRRVAEDTIADVEASGSGPAGRHRGDAGGAVLGGRARASGLSRALPERLHLPLPASGLGAAAPGRRGSPLSRTRPGPAAHPARRPGEPRGVRAPGLDPPRRPLKSFNHTRELCSRSG